MAEKIITLQNAEQVTQLCGNYDKNLYVLKKEYGVEIVIRDLEVKILGEEADTIRCQKAIESLLTLIAGGKDIDDVSLALSLADSGDERVEKALNSLFDEEDLW